MITGKADELLQYILASLYDKWIIDKDGNIILLFEF